MSKNSARLFYIILGLVVSSTLLCSCASYQWGRTNRQLPNGHKKVAIPVFKNLSQEVGIEVGFTNALIREVERSKNVQVMPKSLAEISIEGVITHVSYVGSSKKTSDDLPLLPKGVVLSTQYTIYLNAVVKVIRLHDGFILWEGKVAREAGYSGPQVTTTGVNSVNPLYNLSARRQNIDVMAENMMSEIYDRMTENF